MKTARMTHASLITGLVWLLYVVVPAAQAPTSEVDAHIAAARAAAGQDFRATFVNLCLPAGGGGRGAAGRGAAGAPGAAARGGAGRGGAAAGGGAPAAPDRSGWYASPYKVFDNLYWLGTCQ